MKEICDKIRNKLSAYLDGELSPEEMAEVAAHLETCPDCSALLEKMRKIDEMAETAIPDFDDKLMDSLTGRIMDSIKESKPIAEENRPKSRVIPIWYRYVAVAASIVIVFLAGRMAFKESGGNLLSPPARYEIMAPAAEDTMMPYQESERAAEGIKNAKPKSVSPPKIQTPAGEQKSAPAITEENAVEAHSSPVPSENIEELPAPATIETPPPAEKPTARQKSQATADMVQKQLQEKSSAKSESRGKISGRVVDAKTGEPLFGVSVRIQGTTIGAKSNIDGDFTILSVPPDTYDLVYSSAGYEPIEFTDVPVYPGETEELTVAMTQSVLETGRVTEVRGTRKSIDLLETRTKVVTAAETTMAAAEQGVATEAALPNLDSLEAQYISLMNDYHVREAAQGKKGIVYQKMSGSTQQPAVMLLKIIDSLDTSVAQAKTPAERIDASYMRLRAAFDLYRESGKNEDKNRLEAYKADFTRELSILAKQGHDQKLLDAYRNSIEQLKLQKSP